MANDCCNGNQIRTCDCCGEEPVRIIFRNYHDLEKFREYGNLPGFVSQLFLEVKGGKIFYYPLLDLHIIVCDKCLPRGTDDKVFGQRPHLIKEALDRFDRLIPEDEEDLRDKEAEVKTLAAKLISAQADVIEIKDRLDRKKKSREVVALRNKELNAGRQQIIRVLQAMINKQERRRKTSEDQDNVCDPTFGDIYHCPDCKENVIVHKCHKHSIKPENRKCPRCGKEMVPGAAPR